MPVVCLKAEDVGATGYETPAELEGKADVRAKVEAIRRIVGPMMNLGDVEKKTVPKMSLLAPAREGGSVCTRTFIPIRVHDSIGVFGAVSVATACLVPGSVASEVATITDPGNIEVEHPTGFFTVTMDVEIVGGAVQVKQAALLRTARLLMRGEVLVPGAVWQG
jgi:4-oxalomesaconate tautomerase